MTNKIDHIADHCERMERAHLALTGLSVGDAFGQCFFGHQPDKVDWMILSRLVPGAPWLYTDDTEMALGIYDVLQRHGAIDQDDLARIFAARYARQPRRGYGGTAHDILSSIGNGLHWTAAAGSAFSGMGSMGNGGAMRVAPIGAYFADDMLRVVKQARLSAEITHANLEAQAGAIAIAVAAAFAWTMRDKVNADTGTELIECVLDQTPKSETREGIEKALALQRDLSVPTAVSLLGNGSKIISQDTVPLCLWCVARHFNHFEEAMWTTVAALGDRDTTCAIVGGIVALAAGQKSIPSEWIEAREPLDYESAHESQ